MNWKRIKVLIEKEIAFVCTLKLDSLVNFLIVQNKSVDPFSTFAKEEVKTFLIKNIKERISLITHLVCAYQPM